MVERTCVYPFINRAQETFQSGGSLRAVLESIPDYQKRVNAMVTDLSPKARIPHAIGVSIVGLGAIAIYEYARSKGVPLPDSKEWIPFVVPVASISPENETRPKKLQRWNNEHRKAAERQADIHVESEEWTPEQAQRNMADWDSRHGY